MGLDPKAKKNQKVQNFEPDTVPPKGTPTPSTSPQPGQSAASGQAPAWATGIQTALDNNTKVSSQASLSSLTPEALESAAAAALNEGAWSAAASLMQMAQAKRSELSGKGQTYQVGNKLIQVNADGTATLLYDAASQGDKSMSEYEKASLALDQQQGNQTADANRLNSLVSLINSKRSAYQTAMDRALPEGTEYAPGFEPNGAHAQVSAGLGLPYTPIKQAGHVPIGSPEGDPAWAQAMQMIMRGTGTNRPFDSSASTSTTGADYANKNTNASAKAPAASQESGIPLASTGNYQDDYIHNNLPYAVWASTKTGIPTEWILAMGANETGWGKASAEAPFGIKDTSGGGALLRTVEGADSHPDMARFLEGSSLADHYKNLADEMNSDRWKGASRNSIGDFTSYLTGGNPGGFKWGEASNYGSNIQSISQDIASRLYDKSAFGKWASAASRANKGLLPMDVTLPYWPTDLEKPYEKPIPDWGAW